MLKNEDAVFLVFTVGNRFFALPAERVERVIAAVETLPLPGAPSFLRGVINCGGAAIPVIDLRVRFGLPLRDILISDRFIFVKKEGTLFAFLVEFVDGVRSLHPAKITLPDSSLRRPGEKFEGSLVGMENKEERIILIQTVETLFSMSETDIRCIENICSSLEEAVQ
jgi:purine-binding chemotaxis protein CheW